MNPRRRALLLLTAFGLLLSGILLTSCMGPDWSGSASGSGELTLYLTGTTDGNLEPCNCPGQPRGGLSRRSTLLNTLRQASGRGVLLDAGDVTPIVSDPIIDSYMVRSYGLLGYDAIVPGDQEFDRGLSFLASMQQPGGLPLVACDVTAGGRPVAPPWRRIERQGWSVLVVGLLGPQTMMLSEPDIRAQLEVIDPAKAVAAALADAAQADRAAGRRAPDLIVLLAHMDPQEREPVLSTIHGVDLALISTEMSRPGQVEQIGGVPTVYAPPAGRQIAAITLKRRRDGRPQVVDVQLHPVEQTLPRERKLWELYQAYTFDERQRTLTLVDKVGKIDLVESERCAACHRTQYDWWLKHPHGHAWQTIVREQRTGDPNCMRCHTTGFGFKTGFVSIERTPGLQNVGCQDCHQIDLTTHVAAKPPKNVPRVDPSLCLGCHTIANSPDFDPDVYLPKATCPPGAPTTQPAYHR
ncbi:MAG: hypothetical protein BIFFINMI_03065 [Phycisphaerae bacterium]|nr:hypothetical protein [Phycisphaerae bacterium]